MEMFHHNASYLTSSVWSSLCIMEWDKHICIFIIMLYGTCSMQAFCTLSSLPFPVLCPSHTYFAPLRQIDSLQSSFSLLKLHLLHIMLSPSSLSFLSYRYNIMTQCWQQNLLPTGRQLSWSLIMSTYSVTVCALMTICQTLKMWWLSGACNLDELCTIHFQLNRCTHDKIEVQSLKGIIHTDTMSEVTLHASAR